MHELAARIRADQRRQWLAGNRVLIEVYLDQHPGLRDQEEATVDLIYSEILLREELGEAFRSEEYSERFPQFAARLQRQVEFDRFLRSGLESENSSSTPFLGSTVTEPRFPERGGGARSLPSIPGYETLGELGKGSGGIVFKARQLSVNRLVAIKLLEEEEGLSRREAETAGRLNHPNLVGVYDFGEHAGRCYIAMEYVEGGSLHCKLAKGPLEPRATAELVETLARALHVMHQRGIVHRDLKPANVLLTASGVPKVADFGLAKRLGSEETLAPNGAIVGTVGYMAPEQAAGKNESVGPAADVYALGVILYEALAGRRPFQGDNFLDMLHRMRFEEPSSPRHWQPRVPRDLETICLKCLRKDPKGRYVSAEELAERLRLFLDGKPIPDRPRRWPAKVWRRARAHPFVSTVLVLLGLAVPVVLLASYYLDLERPRREAEADLANGKRVFLRGDKEVPGPFRWVLGGKVALKPNPEEQCFAVDATPLQTSLLELVADPRHESFRFSADMRHDGAAGADGGIGIYFGHSKDTSQGIPQHVFYTVSYSDRGQGALAADGSPTGRVGLHCRYVEERQDYFMPHQERIGKVREFSSAGAMASRPPWRRLEVVVTADYIWTYWTEIADKTDQSEPGAQSVKGELIDRVSRRELWNKRAVLYDDFSLALLVAPQGEQPRPIGAALCSEDLRTGIGFYVCKSTASFRRISVEPLATGE